MLSDIQTRVEQSANTPNYNMCEKLSKPHSSFDMFPTTTQIRAEGEHLLNSRKVPYVLN